MHDTNLDHCAFTPPGMKVAIVHDWLPLYGGAERVLEQILALFPKADLFSLIDFVPEKERSFLNGRHVNTSFIQKLPRARQKYRSYLPLMPLAIEQFDLSGYDLVISSSYAVAKGVITGPDQLHICYCHSPIRYGWDLQNKYLAQAGLHKGISKWLARVLLHYIRMWDMRTAHGVNAFVANSAFVGRRIRKVYGRESEVVHPPVDTDLFTPGGNRGGAYVAVSRFVPYKRIDLIVEAFARMPDRQLLVIGDGPDFKKIQKLAPANVQLLGRQPTSVIIDAMRAARAFVFAAEEDFGIVPLEAQACGTPVIAYGKGGVTETIQHGKTGLFFFEQTAESLCEAITEFEAATFSPERCRENAERFSIACFRRNFAALVQRECTAFRSAAHTKPSLAA